MYSIKNVSFLFIYREQRTKYRAFLSGLLFNIWVYRIRGKAIHPHSTLSTRVQKLFINRVKEVETKKTGWGKLPHPCAWFKNPYSESLERQFVLLQSVYCPCHLFPFRYFSFKLCRYPLHSLSNLSGICIFRHGFRTANVCR